MNPKDELAQQLKARGIAFKRDFQLEQPSTLVFDFGLTDYEIVVDIGLEVDNAKKLKAAISAGWTYYRTQAHMVKSYDAVGQIETIIDVKISEGF